MKSPLLAATVLLACLLLCTVPTASATPSFGRTLGIATTPPGAAFAGTGLGSNGAYAPPTVSDTTPPVISIVAPTNDTVLTAVNATVLGTASDDVAVAKVEVSTDGTIWLLATGTTAWSIQVTLPAGTDHLYARATDTSGNTGTTEVTVTVQLSESGSGFLGVSTPVWILFVVVFVVAVVVAALVVVRRGRRRPPAEDAPPPAGPPRSP